MKQYNFNGFHASYFEDSVISKWRWYYKNSYSVKPLVMKIIKDLGISNFPDEWSEEHKNMFLLHFHSEFTQP